MGKDSPAAQKSRYSHAEEHEPDLSAEVWISLMQGKLKDLPPGKQDPKHLHLASLYDAATFDRFDEGAKEAAEAIRNVSFPPSRSGGNRKIGDMPAGEAWCGVHKVTGLDPRPNEAERNVF